MFNVLFRENSNRRRSLREPSNHSPLLLLEAIQGLKTQGLGISLELASMTEEIKL
jgi:hypothetical protein